MTRGRRAVLVSASIVCAIGIGAVSSESVFARGDGLPHAGKVVARIPIPQGSGGLAVGEGAVWAMSDAASTLTRIDPAGKTVVARIEVKRSKPCPPYFCGGAAAADGAVWVSLLPDDTVARIDPQTNSVTATIPVGPQPDGIAVSQGAIWVANAGDPSLSRIDPATNTVVATIRVGSTPASTEGLAHMEVTAGGGAVWVALPNLHTIVRVDPATNTVAKRIHLSASFGQLCGFLAADARAVWAAGGNCGLSFVTRIDPRTNKPSGRVSGETSPVGLALGFGSLWVADLEAKAIDRVNPRTARVIGRLRVGGYPVGIATGFGSVWLRDDRGRVLRIRPQR